MTGVATYFEVQGLVEVGQVLGRLARLDLVELADVVSEHLVNSTRARIQEDKASPEGEAWAPWSARYDETRNHGVHSLLIGEGHLQGSIDNYSSATEVRVGTPLVYAAVHQFGAQDGSIPARPYLGISALDRLEIEQLALDLFGEALS